MPEAVMPTRPDPEELVSRFGRPCPNCHRPILWPWTNASSAVDRMPVEATPSHFGNVLVYVDPTNKRRLVCDVVGKAADRRRLAAGGWPLYQHHRLHCPKAEQWAGRRSRPIPAVSTSGDLGGLF